ncbi:MAG TPA: methylmalonyl Co-A mutase-associated GTPase MeaB [Puia sp.]|nr:methylmalonyl Co-A mutase-associated GTPase MeaB [Puia sp.]
MNDHFQQALNSKTILSRIRQGDQRMLARAISYIENETPGYRALLEHLEQTGSARVVGITGPPGAGKSTLVDALIGHWTQSGKKIAVLCVDPSSPFHFGALLGDRIRMSEWYNHPMVFIRSLASRGSLGGLNPKIIEITDLIKSAPFDLIVIETVGVGQNEVEIAGLAETTVVVLVPETGDDIQAMKSGLLEIADIFVVNKSDRPDADRFLQHLQSIAWFNEDPLKKNPVILKTIASQKQGIAELAEKILEQQQSINNNEHRSNMFAEKAYQLIIQQRMKDIDKQELIKKIREQMKEPAFNLYQFISNY